MGWKRLDVLVFERGLCSSREQAQGLILSGSVWSGERRLDKPGMKVDGATALEIRSRAPAFASRAGQKLQHALDTFRVHVTDRVCLDIGASTGGFTDCLLKRGARHVFAVDVGYGQLDSRLRQDPRVSVVERTNARYLTPAALIQVHPDAALASLVTMDVSFISLSKIIEPLAGSFPQLRDWVLLFKPQFEVGREAIGKGGLVARPEAVKVALAKFDTFMRALGLVLLGGPESSPLPGKKSGNLELLMHYASSAPTS